MIVWPVAYGLCGYHWGLLFEMEVWGAVLGAVIGLLLGMAMIGVGDVGYNLLGFGLLGVTVSLFLDAATKRWVLTGVGLLPVLTFIVLGILHLYSLKSEKHGVNGQS